MSVVQSTINGTSFESLGAMLLEYEVGPCDYNGGYVVPSQSMIPVKVKHKLGTRKVKLSIDFVGTSLTDVTDKIAAFTKLLHEGADIKLPDNYYYQCYYSGASSPKEKAPWIYQVDFTLEGYKHGALVSNPNNPSQASNYLTFNSTTPSKTLNIIGDIDTPVILSVYGNSNWLEIMGVKVNVNQKWVVIDSYRKTVTYDNNGTVENYFGYTEMTKFPSLKTGDNVITYSSNNNASIRAIIQYYPLYV